MSSDKVSKRERSSSTSSAAAERNNDDLPGSNVPSNQTCSHCGTSLSLTNHRPQTHPVSLSTSHKQVSAFKDELNAVLAGKPESRPYTTVKVLLLNWSNQDLGQVIFDETEELKAVFADLYCFDTESYQIPAKLGSRSLLVKLSQVLLEIDGKCPDAKKLLIVYYNGHGSMDENNRLAWTAYVL